jgi:assimilatory nitrate reductase catalytic subunit
MTNLEGRVIRRRRAYPPPPGVLTDLEIINGLAGHLGKQKYFSFPDAESVFNELRRASAGGGADYSGISYQKIEAGRGVFWPCPSANHPGTPRVFTDRFPTASGRAKFHPVRHQPPAEEPDDEFPLYLTTGRVLAHYQSGTQTRRLARLNQMVSVPQVEINPATAERYDLEDGAPVTLVTRRGSANFSVHFTSDIRLDTLFAPFH